MSLVISLVDQLAVMVGASRNEKGQGMVEYGLILALIAVVCVVAFTTLGTTIGTILGNVASAL